MGGLLVSPRDKGISVNLGSVIQFDVIGLRCRRRSQRDHIVSPIARMHVMTSSTEQFSASITPFEVPEQMRAFAEKGVSQARANYAKFKDVAETHNGTIEAVFTTASKGYSQYSAKLMEIMKANTTATLDFAQELLSVKTPDRKSVV